MSHENVSAFCPLLPANSFTDHFESFTSLLLKVPMLFFDSCNPSLVIQYTSCGLKQQYVFTSRVQLCSVLVKETIIDNTVITKTKLFLKQPNKN